MASGLILPGATIGVLGSGQLGRMFAIAARRMGYRVHTLSPEYDTPTGQVADLEVQANYDDAEAVARFAEKVDVVTFEFENVPVVAVAAAEAVCPVRPSGRVLHITQHRLREKTFLVETGIAVTPFEKVESLADLRKAVSRIGTPCVLKTAGFGYDGKGQSKITDASQVEAAWSAVGAVQAILERFVDFSMELSVVAARGLDGSFAAYPVAENRHERHILDLTVCPARVDPGVAQAAEAIARKIMESLGVVGVMCVEFFLTRDGQLLVNELAPRPHNSGHFSFDAAMTSQFEQQVRAICGLPLGSTELLRPCAMVNLLGDLWGRRLPRWERALAESSVKLHLYGKTVARPGRKMGHITAFGATVDEAAEAALRARRALVED